MVEQSSEVPISGPDETAVTMSDAGPARAETERKLAAALAELVEADHVPADSHFFTDLGANSLVMAQFCARLRKIPDLPSPPSGTSTGTRRSGAWPRPSRRPRPTATPRRPPHPRRGRNRPR